MQTYKFNVVEIPGLDKLGDVPFLPGQYIIAVTGQVYYDPTVGLGKQDRICITEGSDGSVDQVFDPYSINAQSGIAIEQRFKVVQNSITRIEDDMRTAQNPYAPSDNSLPVKDITWDQVENLISTNVTGIYRILDSDPEDGTGLEEGWAFYWVKGNHCYLLELRGSSDPDVDAPEAKIKVGYAGTKSWLYTYPIVLTTPQGGLNTKIVGMQIQDLGVVTQTTLAEVKAEGIYRYCTTEDGGQYIMIVSSYDSDNGIVTQQSIFGSATIQTRTISSSGSIHIRELSEVAYSGSYNDLLNLPNLAKVATTGSYNDLSDKPITYGTDDLAPGTTLATGKIYCMYE